MGSACHGKHDGRMIMPPREAPVPLAGPLHREGRGEQIARRRPNLRASASFVVRRAVDAGKSLGHARRTGGPHEDGGRNMVPSPFTLSGGGGGQNFREWWLISSLRLRSPAPFRVAMAVPTPLPVDVTDSVVSPPPEVTFR